MGLFNRIRKRVNSSVNIQTTNTKDEFYNEKIDTWYNLYSGDLVLGKGKGLNLPKAIIDECCKTAVHEFNFNITTSNQDLLYTNQFLQKNVILMATHLTIGGAVALKPYISENRVGLVIVPATNFIAKFDSFGDLQEVLFKSIIKEDRTVFTLIEDHVYNKATKEYRIDYTLYKSNAYGLTNTTTYGSQCPLSDCSETRGLDDWVVFEDVDRHLCVVKTLGNTQYVNVGQSIFAPALDLIEEADNQFDRVMWEYEGGEMAIQANAELFHKTGSSNKPENYVLPEGRERLYVALYGASNDFNIDTFAPALRDSAYWVGMNNLLRRIEFNCGLSYGILSDANEQAKTATEIVTSKQRYYITIENIRSVLVECIDEILGNIAFLSGRVGHPLSDTAYKVEYDIEDGVMTSSEDKLNEKLLLVDKGVLTVDEFKEWYYSKKNK